VLHPLILVPHGVGALCREHGDDVLSRLIAFPLVQVPVLPECGSLHEPEHGMEIGLTFNAKLPA